ncbi:hypothetical protein E0Z10_g1675 [Xylaria hypoxylon]|uniref:Uncharacterized protein n=1 Tax=Xylaria hypoxylon TaxID=37992 RepID=A0A4Z0ZC21_9PEZI|nr:hypothetical protein E0Z10_g1675 [Xylaria hypoxylon]
MDFSFQALVLHHAAQMNAAFRGLVDALVQNSKLSISLLRISNVTEDSFHVSLEARITKTGPASASITPMKIDLYGPSGHFGNMTFPAIRTQAHGTDVVVTNQLVKIIDKEALKGFIQGIIQNGVVLSLRNGQTSISALGVGPREFVYEKDIELPGMEGPVVSVHKASVIQNPIGVAGSPSVASLSPSSTAHLVSSPTTASISSIAGPGSRNTISIVFHISNPTPLEVSFGTCSFDIEDHEGKLVAELKGRLDIRRNQFEATFQGAVNKAVAAKLAVDMREAVSRRRNAGSSENERSDSQSPKARLIGKRCAGAGWCDETIKGINVPLQNVRKLFCALGVDDNTQEPGEKKGGFPKWKQRWMMR